MTENFKKGIDKRPKVCYNKYTNERKVLTMMLKDLELVLYHIRVNYYFCAADDLAVSMRNGFDDVVIRVTNMKTYQSQEFNYTETLQEILDLQAECE